MLTTIQGSFPTAHEAQLAYHALVDAGIPKGDLSLIVADERNGQNQSTQSLHRIVRGLIPGAILGALVAFLLYRTGYVARGLAPLVHAGAFVTALFGAVVGAILGALGGTLSGVEPAAGTSVQNGTQAILRIRTEDVDSAKVQDTLRERGARDVRSFTDDALARGLRETKESREERVRGDQRQPVPPLP